MFAVSLSLAAGAAAEGNTAPKLPDVEWRDFNGNLSAQRYSPLDQINAGKREQARHRVALAGRHVRTESPNSRMSVRAQQRVSID